MKAKHYLSGIDWVIHSLDDLLKRQSGIGNVCQIVLKLKRCPDPIVLQRALSQFITHYPVVNGTAKRAWNLAPYWKIPQDRVTPSVRFHTIDLSEGEVSRTPEKVLERTANRPFPDKWTHLAFYLVSTGTNAFFAMTFDHRLFDAYGAESFLNLFGQYYENSATPLPALPLPTPHHLNRWKEKFLAGQRVNRHLLALGRDGPPCVMPTTGIEPKNRFRFHRISFTRKETETILSRAYRQAGYLMLMPFLTVASIRAFHPIFSQRSENPHADYVIPINIDTRSSENRSDTPFFNHVSFLFIRVKAETADSMTDLIEAVKSQIFNSMKVKLPQDIQTASYLMRIVPTSILHRLVGFHMGGHLASFCFSFLADSGFRGDSFAGSKVQDLFHMPAVPIPSGLGLFFHRFQRRLKVYISYADGLLSGNELKMLNSRLADLLVGNATNG